MMIIEKIPIEIYVKTKFEEKSIISIIENWRVESEEVQEIIISQFKELGMFEVDPIFEKDLKPVIVGFLTNSPQILKLVKRAERRAALLKNRAHAK